MTLSPWWETMIAKYGSRVAVLDEMRERAALGGATKTSKPKGFALMPKDRLSEVSVKGATSPKRKANEA